MGKNKKPRKERKPREMNPVALVMTRGLNTTTKKQADGSHAEQADPRGVVLAPVQTMVLAAFIQEQTKTIGKLNAIIEMMQEEDQDEDELDA